MALTNKEKQSAFRKRNADAGRFELRGVFVTEAEKVLVKNKIKKLLSDEK